MPLLQGNEAVNIYQKFRELKTIPMETNPSQTESTNSAICRICRYQRISRDLIESPCKCKGTLGYVHDKCLNQWKNVRKSNICEICHQKYELTNMSIPFRKLFRNFFKRKYLGPIMKNVLNLSISTWLFGTNVCQMNDLVSVLGSENAPFLAQIICPLFLLGSGLILYAYAETTDIIVNEMIEDLSDWWWSAFADDIYNDE